MHLLFSPGSSMHDGIHIGGGGGGAVERESVVKVATSVCSPYEVHVYISTEIFST